MPIEKYFVCEHVNICFDCQRAVGGCSWSEIDPKTNKPRFKFVDGSITKKVKRKVKGRFVDEEMIVSCPLFLPDEKNCEEEND